MWNKQQKRWAQSATRVVAASNYGNQGTFATMMTNVLMVGEVIIGYLRYQGNQRNYRNMGNTSCFSDRASWIDYTLTTNFDALIIIYS